MGDRALWRVPSMTRGHRPTAADFRRAELRRKLRKATERRDVWWHRFMNCMQKDDPFRACKRTAARVDYWADIARILRRTLREERKRA